MYKAIIFDLDNTLLNYSTSELHSMQNTVKEHGLTENKLFNWSEFWGLYQKINMNHWNDRVKSNYSIYQVLEKSFQDTINELNLDYSESTTLAKSYWQTFCNTYHFEEYAPEILSLLHGKYKLAIISNGIGEAQRSRLAVGGIAHYFDALVVSDEVRYWKPDKEIFNLALKQLNVDHTEALYIGDSINDDYYGALNAGIDFCLYNPKGIPVQDKVRPKFIVEKLEEILNVLG